MRIVAVKRGEGGGAPPMTTSHRVWSGPGTAGCTMGQESKGMQVTAQQKAGGALRGIDLVVVRKVGKATCSEGKSRKNARTICTKNAIKRKINGPHVILIEM